MRSRQQALTRSRSGRELEPKASGAPGVNGVNPLPTRYAYGYAYGLRLRPTPAGLATLFDRPRGAHVKSDRQLVPPVKTERARARAPVKLSNAETALSKQQPRPDPYYPPLGRIRLAWYG